MMRTMETSDLTEVARKRANTAGLGPCGAVEPQVAGQGRIAG